jgi:hypothetical protein
MGLIWNRSESEAFQSRLAANLTTWDHALNLWKARLSSLETRLGFGPSVELSGQA